MRTRKKHIIFGLYTTGGLHQGNRYYADDYQGLAEYLQEQLNKKHALMSTEEYRLYLDDDYMWNKFD